MLSKAMIKKLHKLKELLPQIEEFDQQCDLIQNDFFLFLSKKVKLLPSRNDFDDEEKKAVLECQAIFSALYKKRLADLMLQYYDLIRN